jgi:hypothetical protein
MMQFKEYTKEGHMDTRVPLALAILNCCTNWAAAQDINVKSGLWEVTRTTEVKSGMSAAEKAEKEKIKKDAAVSGLDRPDVQKMCLSQARIDGSMAYPGVYMQMQMGRNRCKQEKLEPRQRSW